MAARLSDKHLSDAQALHDAHVATWNGADARAAAGTEAGL